MTSEREGVGDRWAVRRHRVIWEKMTFSWWEKERVRGEVGEEKERGQENQKRNSRIQKVDWLTTFFRVYSGSHLSIHWHLLLRHLPIPLSPCFSSPLPLSPCFSPLPHFTRSSSSHMSHLRHREWWHLCFEIIHVTDRRFCNHTMVDFMLDVLWWCDYYYCQPDA